MNRYILLDVCPMASQQVMLDDYHHFELMIQNDEDLIRILTHRIEKMRKQKWGLYRKICWDNLQYRLNDFLDNFSVYFDPLDKDKDYSQEKVAKICINDMEETQEYYDVVQKTKKRFLNRFGDINTTINHYEICHKTLLGAFKLKDKYKSMGFQKVVDVTRVLEYCIYFYSF